MHKRRAILEAIQAKLKTLTGFSGVWIQRIPPKRAAWPCVTLHVENETATAIGIQGQPRCLDREASVSINAWARGSPDDEKAERDLDAAALLIETAIDEFFGALNLSLESTNFVVDEEEPEIHTVELIYRLNYDTTESNPAGV